MKKIIVVLFVSLPTFVFSQAGSEIYLVDMQVKGTEIRLSNPVNITNHKGYDNQPMFSPNASIIYYTSDRDSTNTDIKMYNYKTGKSRFFTNTSSNEYSATVTPDGKFISCIIARKKPFAQDLGKFPINGGEPIILINNLIVGYHAWIDNHRLLLFILDDTNHNSLHYYNLETKEDKIIAQNPGRTLSKIPGENAMSFIDKTDRTKWTINKLDIGTMKITEIGETLPGQEYMTWTNNGMIIMSNGNNLFSLKPGKGAKWKPVVFMHDGKLMQGISRLAVNKTNSKMCIVVKE